MNDDIYKHYQETIWGSTYNSHTPSGRTNKIVQCNSHTNNTSAASEVNHQWQIMNKKDVSKGKEIPTETINRSLTRHTQDKILTT